MDPQKVDTVSDKEDKIKNIITSNAFILTVLPIFFFLVFAIYQVGYFSFFNLPINYISIDLSSVLKEIDKIFLSPRSFIILSIFFSFFVTFRFDLGKKYARYLTPLILLLFYLFQKIELFLDFQNMRYLVQAITAFLLILINYFWFSNKTYKGIKGWVNKTNHRIELRKNIRKRRTFWENLLVSTLKIIIFIQFSYSFIYDMGYLNAKSQQVFYVANTSPKSVVILFTDDYAICYPYNVKDNSINNEFYLLDYSRDSEIVFSSENVGPLKINSQ